MLKKLRQISLTFAESFDTWRIIPITMLIGYSILVFNLYTWYVSIPTYIKESCDAAVLQTLAQYHLPIQEAKIISCSVVDVVGGPTANQTILVTSVIGLATLIFGLFSNSGRKWETNPINIKEENEKSED